MRTAVLIKIKGDQPSMEHYSKAGVARDEYKRIVREGEEGLDRLELWTSDGGRIKKSKRFGLPETQPLVGSRATAGAQPDPQPEKPAAPEPASEKAPASEEPAAPEPVVEEADKKPKRNKKAK